MVQLFSPEQNTGDLDVKWLSFIQTNVNSFTKWDLLHFFYDNPHTLDSADNIASFIVRDTASVAAALDGLVRAGMVEREQRSGVVIYHLSKHQEVRQTVTDFIRACHNRDFRARAIRTVLKTKHLS